MFKLNVELLAELGLKGLPDWEKQLMLEHIYESLEMRVGVALASEMSDDQLDEFETYIDSDDEAGALRWLEGSFPNYREVVASELELLKGEIQVSAKEILDAADLREHRTG